MNLLKNEIYPEDLIKEIIYNIETKGYHVIENFLDIIFCDILKTKLQYTLNNYKVKSVSKRSELDKYHMHDLLSKDFVFSMLLEDPRLDQIIKSVLCSNWIMYSFTSSSLPPKGDNYGSRIHVDSPRIILNYPTNFGVIWTLDNFTIENGGTYVLPGSHNSKIEPTENIFNNNSVQIVCKKGSFILFNARVWHRGGVNNSSEFRHALTMNVCRPYMKQRFDWVRFIPKSITDKLNEQARRIIGFDTRIPSTIDEFFQEDEKRLYKSGQE